MIKLLSLQLGGTETDKYPTVNVYNSSNVSVFSGNLTHVYGGLYQVSHDFSTSGDYSVVYKVYSDSSHSTIDTTYDTAVQESINVPDSADIGTIKDIVTDILKITGNDQRLRTDNNTLVIYDDDGTTPLLIYDLFDKDGNATFNGVFYRRKQ